MQDCQIAMTAISSLDQCPNAANTGKEVPGSKMGIGVGIERRSTSARS